jgi:hypothetical protein
MFTQHWVTVNYRETDEGGGVLRFDNQSDCSLGKHMVLNFDY